MITGANTNVSYRGILFHVQTEDSGRANPHIISHLYHGGTILGSQKTDYREHLESDDLLGTVKKLIDEQHAAMVDRLKSGGFDEVIQDRLVDTAGETGPTAAPARDSKPETRPDASERSSPRTPAIESDVDAPARTAEARATALATALPARDERTFGESVGGSRPLDEVILDYLCDKARGRRADGAEPPRGGRSDN